MSSILNFLASQPENNFISDLKRLCSDKQPQHYGYEELSDWVKLRIGEAQKGVNQNNLSVKANDFASWKKIEETFFLKGGLFEEDPNQLSIF